MTHEEILSLIEYEGVDKFIAGMRALGYYVQVKQSVPNVDDSLLVTGTLRLLDARGFAQTGMGVILETPTQNLRVQNVDGNYYNIGVSRTTQTVQVTPSGTVSIKLVKGARVRVSVENSSINREFIVPDTDFDILTVDNLLPDLYSTVVKPYQYAFKSDL
jgi:hypothetical protein